MTKIFIILGIICILYYMMMFIHTKLETSFSRTWLWMAAVFFLSAYGSHHNVFHKFPAPVKQGLLLLFLIGACIFIYVELQIVRYMFKKTEKNAPYILVLGAQVRGKKLTLSLKKRLDGALIYLNRYPNTMVICSGGQGPGEDISEAKAMEKYLIKQGIDKGRIMLEDQSTTTKENISNSLFLIEDMNSAVVICTNNFHLYRAVAIGKKIGLKTVSGLSGSGDPWLFINYAFREFFAIIKEKMVGNI